MKLRAFFKEVKSYFYRPILSKVQVVHLMKRVTRHVVQLAYEECITLRAGAHPYEPQQR